jgi:hypothetical protein
MAKRRAGLRFQVLINGRQACVSGMDGYGVLSAVLSRVKRSPKAYPGKNKHPLKIGKAEWSKERIEFDVGGLDSIADQHLHWLKRDLRIGDEIVIRVLSGGKHDAPKGQHRRLTARRSRTRAKAARAARRGR